MVDRDSITYPGVPKEESWVIPFWDWRDRDEFEDLTDGLALMGEPWFRDVLWTFRKAVMADSVVGVRFYVGCDLSEGITLVLRPATRTQAGEMLQAAAGFLGFDRGMVPWDRIATHLLAIREVVVQSENVRTPSFGFSAIIPDSEGRRGQFMEASTSWLGRQQGNNELR